VLRRALHLRFRHGFRMDEAASAGLLDPRVAVEGSWSRRRIRPIQARLNPPELWATTENKAVFHHLCAAAGLPVPALHAVLSRGGGGWTCDGEAPSGPEAWADAFQRVLPDEFISKPVRGHWGLAVRAFRRVGTAVLEIEGGGYRSMRELHDALLSEPRFETFMLQERVQNDPAIEELCGSQTLQTIRLITLAGDGDEAAEVLTGYSKIVTGDTPVDNWHDGKAGNGSAAIDLLSGRLHAALLPRDDGLGAREVDTHPRTGERVTGFQLPHWPETVEVVVRAAAAFAPARALAWDIGLSADGPVLIEANALWGPMNEWDVMPELMRRLEASLRYRRAKKSPKASVSAS
jgi:hypothetical protein